MKDYSTIINTTLGSVFSIIVLNPTEIITTFILGAVGAAGAYLATLFLKWMAKKIEKWLS